LSGTTDAWQLQSTGCQVVGTAVKAGGRSVRGASRHAAALAGRQATNLSPSTGLCPQGAQAFDFHNRVKTLSAAASRRTRCGRRSPSGRAIRDSPSKAKTMAWREKPAAVGRPKVYDHWHQTAQHRQLLPPGGDIGTTAGCGLHTRHRAEWAPIPNGFCRPGAPALTLPRGQE
jgi:hypothetical protein